MRLIYLSPLPWCSFTQRPHEFVAYFHKATGGEVLWIDPYPTRLPKLTDINRLKGNTGNIFRALPEWLKVLHPLALPLEPIPGGSALNGLLWKSIIRKICAFAEAGETALAFGKPSAMAFKLLEILDVTWSLYDAMDDFPNFHTGVSRKSMAGYERAISQRVSRLMVSSSNLVQKFARQSRSATLIRNACSKHLPWPRDRRRHGTRPQIGYLGTLNDWFDWGLLSRLARSQLDCDFRLIGPLISGPVPELPRNVEIQPPLEHSAAMSAMRDFDVGLIPFKKNVLTESVDPIKYYEYRALGLPVISSAFGEMALRDEQEGVFLLEEEDDYTVAFQKALQYQCDEKSVRRFREMNSWEKRFEAAGLFK